MILYHGSTVPVEKPEIRISESFLDFGTGFYTTTSLQQAERWARIKTRRENKPVGYVSVYEFDFDAAKSRAVIHRYQNADMEWAAVCCQKPQRRNDRYSGGYTHRTGCRR